MVAHKGELVIHEQIRELLKSNPEGLTIYQIREKFPSDPGIQQHLDRRVRELRKWYEVPPAGKGGKYVYKGEKATPAKDSGAVSSKLRAAVFHKAGMRCEMCGKTVKDDGVKLEADHRLPQSWGGETTEDNLWALCRECNNGKKDFFSSLDKLEMATLLKKDSVYERIAGLLHKHEGKPVPSWLLEFVANFNDFQEDWQKRLRELRYSVIGMKIKATRAKTPSGKWQAAYVLEKWKPLPQNHKFLIKEYERKKRRERED